MKDIHNLGFSEISSLLNDAKDLGASYVIITGGEPLLRDDLVDIVGLTYKMGFQTLIATNGLLLNRTVASKLALFSNLSIQISLEGHKAGYHDFLRGVKGSFDKALKACRICASLEIPFSTSMTLTKGNFEDVDSFVEFSKELGAKNIKLRRFIASGKGYKNHSLLELNKEEMKKIVEITVRKNQTINPEVELTIEQAPFGVLFFEERDALAATRGLCTGCSAGIALCVIGPDGSFRPCPSIPISVADTKEQSLRDIWQNNSVLHALRERTNLTGKCRKCPYRMICGGCRADAYCLNGDLFAEDPLCWYQPDMVVPY